MDHHEKLKWSSHHLEALDLEIQDFIQKNPLRACCEQEGDSRRFRIIACDYPPLPPHWSLMMGDAIQNMRGALDHLIWALIDKTVANGGIGPNDREALKVGYPTSVKEGAYLGVGDQLGNGARKRQAGWIGDRALAIVDSTQPYRSLNDPNTHPLAVLAAYSNEDKHRNLVAGAALADSVQFTIKSTEKATGQFIMTSVGLVRPGEWWFYSGADLGTCELGEGSTHAPGEVEVIPDLTGTIAFRQKGPAPPIDARSLKELGEALLQAIVVPLDALLV